MLCYRQLFIVSRRHINFLKKFKFFKRLLLAKPNFWQKLYRREKYCDLDVQLNGHYFLVISMILLVIKKLNILLYRILHLKKYISCYTKPFAHEYIIIYIPYYINSYL